MKDQYVGDIGDYGKYGLLRFLSGKGIRLGINWYRTKNDGSNDGKFTEYLKDTRKNGDMQYDEELFEALKSITKKGEKQKTALFQMPFSTTIFYLQTSIIAVFGTIGQRKHC